MSGRLDALNSVLESAAAPDQGSLVPFESKAVPCAREQAACFLLLKVIPQRRDYSGMLPPTLSLKIPWKGAFVLHVPVT